MRISSEGGSLVFSVTWLCYLPRVTHSQLLRDSFIGMLLSFIYFVLGIKILKHSKKIVLVPVPVVFCFCVFFAK